MYNTFVQTALQFNESGMAMIGANNPFVKLIPNAEDVSVTWPQQKLVSSNAQVAIVGYPNAWEKPHLKKELVTLGTYPASSNGTWKGTPGSCTDINDVKCSDFLIGHVIISAKANENITEKYLEYRTMPIFLGWYQKGDGNEKKNWLNGKCEQWLRAPGAKRLRDDVEPDFQCPCTLDRALAIPGFGKTDSFCTDTFCKYNNYNAATVCIESFIRSNKGYGLRCCYNKDLIYTGQQTSGRSYLFEYPVASLGGALESGSVEYLSNNLVELSGWYACCSQNSETEHCKRFVESRAIPNDCAKATQIGSASVAGDPHFLTFAGNNYTFSAAGEFWFVNSSDGNLKVQSRFKKLSSEATNTHATRMTSMSINYKPFPTIEIRINPAIETFGQKNRNLISADRKLVALFDKVEVRAAISGSTVLLQNSVQLLFDNLDQKNIQVVFTQHMISLDCQFVPLDTTGELNCRLQIPSSYKNKISGLAGGRQLRDQSD
jgi:hypothetical protein